MKPRKKNMKRWPPLLQKGFTLLEVALAVVVGGMLLAFFGQSLTNTLNESKIKTTQSRIDEVNNALRRFASYSNYVPCPADRTQATTAATYGQALPDCRTSAGALGGTDTDAGVRIGMVPTRTLNLPDEYGYDGWGMRLIYAVTESMTRTATYDPTAANVNILGMGSAAYAIVSTGANRKGSFSSSGQTGPACGSAPGADTENCDGDATFSEAMQSASPGNSYFDDQIEYHSLQADIDEIPEGAVMPFRLSTCPKGWDKFDDLEGKFVVGRGAFTNPAPSKTAGAYGKKTYNPGDIGGSATRRDKTPGKTTGVSEYRNFPPYIAYTYCVKS